MVDNVYRGGDITKVPIRRGTTHLARSLFRTFVATDPFLRTSPAW